MDKNELTFEEMQQRFTKSLGALTDTLISVEKQISNKFGIGSKIDRKGKRRRKIIKGGTIKIEKEEKNFSTPRKKVFKKQNNIPEEDFIEFEDNNIDENLNENISRLENTQDSLDESIEELQSVGENLDVESRSIIKKMGSFGLGAMKSLASFGVSVAEKSSRQLTSAQLYDVSSEIQQAKENIKKSFKIGAIGGPVTAATVSFAGELLNELITSGKKGLTKLGLLNNDIYQENEGIPEFQEGGVIPGKEGEKKLVYAHGGEVVLNKEQQERMLQDLENIPKSIFEFQRSMAGSTIEETGFGLRKIGMKILPMAGGGYLGLELGKLISRISGLHGIPAAMLSPVVGMLGSFATFFLLKRIAESEKGQAFLQKINYVVKSASEAKAQMPILTGGLMGSMLFSSPKLALKGIGGWGGGGLMELGAGLNTAFMQGIVPILGSTMGRGIIGGLVGAVAGNILREAYVAYYKDIPFRQLNELQKIDINVAEIVDILGGHPQRKSFMREFLEDRFPFLNWLVLGGATPFEQLTGKNIWGWQKHLKNKVKDLAYKERGQAANVEETSKMPPQKMYEKLTTSLSKLPFVIQTQTTVLVSAINQSSILMATTFTNEIGKLNDRLNVSITPIFELLASEKIGEKLQYSNKRKGESFLYKKSRRRFLSARIDTPEMGLRRETITLKTPTTPMEALVALNEQMFSNQQYMASMNQYLEGIFNIEKNNDDDQKKMKKRGMLGLASNFLSNLSDSFFSSKYALISILAGIPMLTDYFGRENTLDYTRIAKMSMGTGKGLTKGVASASNKIPKMGNISKRFSERSDKLKIAGKTSKFFRKGLTGLQFALSAWELHEEGYPITDVIYGALGDVAATSGVLTVLMAGAAAAGLPLTWPVVLGLGILGGFGMDYFGLDKIAQKMAMSGGHAIEYIVNKIYDMGGSIKEWWGKVPLPKKETLSMESSPIKLYKPSTSFFGLEDKLIKDRYSSLPENTKMYLNEDGKFVPVISQEMRQRNPPSSGYRMFKDEKTGKFVATYPSSLPMATISTSQNVGQISNIPKQSVPEKGKRYSLPTKFEEIDFAKVSTLSSEFESNNDPFNASIGSIKLTGVNDKIQDPGGRSLGLWQMSSSTSYSFISKSEEGRPYRNFFKDPTTKKLFPSGSNKFINTWMELTQSHPSFINAQRNYLINTHFKPAYEYAYMGGLPHLHDPGVLSAIFSCSLQHGGWHHILNSTIVALKGVKNVTPKDVINTIYNERGKYVLSLRNIDKKLARSLIDNRYTKERKEALKISEEAQKENEDSIKEIEKNIPTDVMPLIEIASAFPYEIDLNSSDALKLNKIDDQSLFSKGINAISGYIPDATGRQQMISNTINSVTEGWNKASGYIPDVTQGKQYISGTVESATKAFGNIYDATTQEYMNAAGEEIWQGIQDIGLTISNIPSNASGVISPDTRASIQSDINWFMNTPKVKATLDVYNSPETQENLKTIKDSISSGGETVLEWINSGSNLIKQTFDYDQAQQDLEEKQSQEITNGINTGLNNLNNSVAKIPQETTSRISPILTNLQNLANNIVVNNTNSSSSNNVNTGNNSGLINDDGDLLPLIQGSLP